jgi:hypothetical protein
LYYFKELAWQTTRNICNSMERADRNLEQMFIHIYKLKIINNAQLRRIAMEKDAK